MPVTWKPPEAPAFSCTEFQGAAPVALREPHNLAGESGSCRGDDVRPPTSVEEAAASILLAVISRSLESGPLLASPPCQEVGGGPGSRAGWLAADFLTRRGQRPESLCIYHPHT